MLEELETQSDVIAKLNEAIRHIKALEEKLLTPEEINNIS